MLIVGDSFYFYKKTIDSVWNFPKGHPNKGETDELTVAAREFEEETNIKVEFLKRVEKFRYEHTFVNPKGVARKLVLFLARCDYNPALSQEHKAFVWANIDKEEFASLIFSWQTHLRAHNETTISLVHR